MKRTGQKLRIVSGPVASPRRPRRGNPRLGGAPRRPVKATLKEVLPERVDASASTPGEDTPSVDSGSPPSNGAEAPARTTPVYQPLDQEEAAASTHEETAASQHTIAWSPAPPAVTEPAAPVQHAFPALARPQRVWGQKAPPVHGARRDSHRAQIGHAGAAPYRHGSTLAHPSPPRPGLGRAGLCDRRRRPRSLERPTRSPFHAG